MSPLPNAARPSCLAMCRSAYTTHDARNTQHDTRARHDKNTTREKTFTRVAGREQVCVEVPPTSVRRAWAVCRLTQMTTALAFVSSESYTRTHTHAHTHTHTHTLSPIKAERSGRSCWVSVCFMIVVNGTVLTTSKGFVATTVTAPATRPPKICVETHTHTES